MKKLISQILAMFLVFSLGTSAVYAGTPANPKASAQQTETSKPSESQEWNVHISGTHIMIFGLTMTLELFLSHIFTSGYAEMLFRSFVIYPSFYGVVTSDWVRGATQAVGPAASGFYDSTLGPTIDHGVNRFLNFGSSLVGIVSNKIKSLEGKKNL